MLLFWIQILVFVLKLINQKLKDKTDKNIKNNNNKTNILSNFKISLKEKIFTKNEILKGKFKKTSIVSQFTKFKLCFEYLEINITIKTK